MSYKNMLPNHFSKIIDDIDFKYNNTNKLGDLGGGPLGTAFDLEMERIIRDGWTKGTFEGLSKEVADRLKELKLQGYELVIKPKVSIGNHTPEPDLLFIKKDGPDFILDECIYIDNKYFYDVDFTTPQKAILQPFKDNKFEAVVYAKGDLFVGNIRVAKDGDVIKIKKIEVFTVLEDFELGKIDKPEL